MSKMQIALDLGAAAYELHKHGFSKTLLYAEEAGAKSVVLPYHYPFDLATAREYVNKGPATVSVIGLEALTEHLGIHQYERVLDEEIDTVIETAVVLGAKNILIAEMPREILEGESGISATCEKLIALSERLQKYDLRLQYCCHIEEFERIDSKYILDHLLDNVPSEKMGFVLDTFWTHLGGQITENLLRRLAGRCEILALQELEIRPPVGDHLVRSLLLDSCVRSSLLGAGNLGIENIINVAKETGVQTLLVRQEETYEQTMFECAKLNLDYLAQKLN